MFTKVLRIPAILIYVITLTSACMATSDFTLQDSKRLYQQGQYRDCIEKSRISSTPLDQKKQPPKMTQDIVQHYEIISDCYNQLGDAHQAAQTLDTLLSQVGQNLSQEETARIRLKKANQFKGAGLFSEAIFSYTSIINDYETIFPDRFARYANENRSEINDKKAAEIHGRVNWPNGASGIADEQKAVIRVFNGFEESKSYTDAQGRFDIPLFNKTSQQYILSVSSPGYEPWIKTLGYSGENQIQLNPIPLKENDSKETIVTGILYSRISGGKRINRRGISILSMKSIQFVPVSNISSGTAKELEPITAKSDANGIYRIALPPGIYHINAHKHSIELNIDKDEAIIHHFQGGSKIID